MSGILTAFAIFIAIRIIIGLGNFFEAKKNDTSRESEPSSLPPRQHSNSTNNVNENIKKNNTSNPLSPKEEFTLMQELYGDDYYDEPTSCDRPSPLPAQKQESISENKSENDIRKEVTLNAFLNLCAQRNFNTDATVQIACRVNKKTSAISTFSVRLFPKDKKLNGLVIAPSDKNADCWFDDAISLKDLGVNFEDIDGFMSFSTSAEAKGTAINALIAFDKFMKEIEDSNIGMTIYAWNTSVLFHWIGVTFITSKTLPTSQFLLDAVNHLMSRFK